MPVFLICYDLTKGIYVKCSLCVCGGGLYVHSKVFSNER